MCIPRFSVCAAARVAVCATVFVAGAARADNVNFPFNAADGGWTVSNSGSIPATSQWEWTPFSPSATEGGWHTRRGSEQPGTGTYLTSPCFFLDGNYGVDKKNAVYFEVYHRYAFGGGATGDPLVALGQVQYRINGGEWTGVRTSDFVSSPVHYLPTYSSPPSPFVSLTSEPPPGGWGVDAWAGYTRDFGIKDHEPSAFELTFDPAGPYSFQLGDEIEFRFLMGTQVPLSGSSQLVWELDSVQIKGVVPCPEPGGIALATAGLLIGLGDGIRRRFMPRDA